MIGSPAERAVIGSVLLDSRVAKMALDEVAPEDFSVGQLEQVWSGIGRMIAERDPVDVITVSGKLADWSVRGLNAADLHMMVTDTPVAASVLHYARQVRVDSIRRSLRTISSRMVQDTENVAIAPGETVANILNSLRDLQSAHSRSELDAKELDIVLQETDSYDWAIPNLIERRDRLVLTGAEGAGKSTFVRQLAITSASGLHPFTGMPIDPVKVLVVDAENSEQQWRRAARTMVHRGKQLGVGDPGMNVILACTSRLDLTRDSHLGQVHKLIDDHNPDIVVIGPLYRLTPKAINSDDDAAPLLTALDTIRDRNIALVMEAHAGHALGIGGERDLRPRGSAALMGWPEFGLGIRPVRDDPDLYSLIRWRGDRDARDWPHFLRRGGTWPWSLTPEG